LDLETITPIIITFNEEPNIGRTLAALSWAKEVVVVDSLSSDRTRDIAAAHPNVRVRTREFDAHAAQWNFAIADDAILTDWILCLDADYVLSDDLIAELKTLTPPPETCGYEARFVYCIAGHALRGSVYPPVTILFRRGVGRYRQDGHTQRLEVTGAVQRLSGAVLHDDRKPLSRWLASQSRYMELEARKLEEASSDDLALPDRIRKAIVLAPPLVLIYTLVIKGAILDGWPGLYYAMQRAAAELILSLHLLHRRFFGR
jgi:glycosyltransferase involved in cell wall biosynthesis